MDSPIQSSDFHLQNISATWIMQHPDGSPAIKQAIDAFIDDTTLITGGRMK